ncbi:FKBP-type peptidyl-prolyl cis-trans isomerase [Ekhidna sp. To15]|uniref:FKBP-type peptidyl-prolyl cis-trans isomerase n=1 Tax=Ekhidna sp. To15 TaxID=3395267 RepID=UPI003F5284D8
MRKIYTLLCIFSIVTFSGCGSDDAPAVSAEEQLEIDLEIIDDYLDDNNINAQIHESEIRYVMNRIGDGESPAIGNELMVKFESYYLDGVNAGSDTIGFSVQLTETIIEAWQLIVPEMKEGGKITFYPPSGYLFGPTGLGSTIPPNAIIVYEIELIAIVNSDNERFALEEDIIDEYLLESNIEAEIHPSGIRYELLEEGTGDSPTISDNVLVVYEGTFLNGQIFDVTNTGASIILSRVIESWQIMLPIMKEGGRIKFYAPSSYCYGTGGFQSISPNTILAFEIELIEVRS